MGIGIFTLYYAIELEGLTKVDWLYVEEFISVTYLFFHILWEERIIRSVAILTRNDGTKFLNLAVQVPVKTTVELFSLPQAMKPLTN